jgi:hypothetical protein
VGVEFEDCVEVVAFSAVLWDEPDSSARPRIGDCSDQASIH